MSATIHVFPKLAGTVLDPADLKADAEAFDRMLKAEPLPRYGRPMLVRIEMSPRHYRQLAKLAEQWNLNLRETAAQCVLRGLDEYCGTKGAGRGR